MVLIYAPRVGVAAVIKVVVISRREMGFAAVIYPRALLSRTAEYRPPTVTRDPSPSGRGCIWTEVRSWVAHVAAVSERAPPIVSEWEVVVVVVGEHGKRRVNLPEVVDAVGGFAFFLRLLQGRKQ